MVSSFLPSLAPLTFSFISKKRLHNQVELRPFPSRPITIDSAFGNTKRTQAGIFINTVDHLQVSLCAHRAVAKTCYFICPPRPSNWLKPPLFNMPPSPRILLLSSASPKAATSDISDQGSWGTNGREESNISGNRKIPPGGELSSSSFTCMQNRSKVNRWFVLVLLSSEFSSSASQWKSRGSVLCAPGHCTCYFHNHSLKLPNTLLHLKLLAKIYQKQVFLRGVRLDDCMDYIQ